MKETLEKILQVIMLDEVGTSASMSCCTILNAYKWQARMRVSNFRYLVRSYRELLLYTLEEIERMERRINEEFEEVVSTQEREEVD